MAYECKLILDSTTRYNQRLMTYEITFPRVVLAEVVTHRILQIDSGCEILMPDRTALQTFSKSSASSRAIPFKRMVQPILDDPYIPERWSKSTAGMQEKEWLSGWEASEARKRWLQARDYAVECATYMHEAGVHKQDVNRLLEPWMWVKQIITGTDWNNFFALRTDKDAHPSFRTIARMMYVSARTSHPTLLNEGEWHAPYVGQGALNVLAANMNMNSRERTEEGRQINEDEVLKISAARCAWVSYDPPNIDEKFTVEKALATYDKLMGGKLKHVSPCGHQARPFARHDGDGLKSNLRGWVQYRKTLSGEQASFEYPSLDDLRKWCQESDVVAKHCIARGIA